MSRRESARFEWERLREVEWHDVMVRFAFGATISLVAALIGARFGAFVGGAFLAFPAILPATLTLVQRHGSRADAELDDRGAAAGAPGLVAFAALVWLVPHHPAIVLPAAVVVWFACAFATYRTWRFVRRSLGLEDGHATSTDGEEEAAERANERRRGAPRD